MGIYLATAIVLIAYLLLAWFAGSWLHLQGSSLWLVRGGLALIGFIGAGVFLWFHRKLTRDGTALGVGMGAPVITEIDALLNQADRKLKAAKITGGASLRTVPIVFLLGEPNSAKTSTMLHSGLDPELLAGVVYRETETVQTNTLNLWFARGTVFLELGGAVLGDPRLWMRILNRTSSAGFASAFGRAEPAARAVVVCCDCERLQAGAEKFTPTARKLGGQLQAMANAIGASFPIYTLFTKLDQVPKFAYYVSNLTADEAHQILGSTVPQRVSGEGVFAEEERTRLGEQFDQLVYSLAEKRLDYLSRENALAKLPAIYEFPREFRKIRDHVLTFLVEMSRPTQLGTNPFLRGFYFSGVRPVMFRENVTVAPAPDASTEAVGSGATRILSASSFANRSAVGAGSANVVRSRRVPVPEWTFLPNLFSEVVLRDRAALGTSSQSSKTNVIRRLLLATLASVFISTAIAFLISFLNNRELQQEVMTADRALAATVAGPVENPTADQLMQLERLRTALVTLEANQKNGAPLSYRWGLYNGEQLYPEARRVYFGYFRRLLLDSTQKSIVATLRQLPAKPGPADPYQEPYDALKAHLITTSRHDQSSREFLARVLLRSWSAGKGLDQEMTDLARKQFEYYSDALIAADPYPSASDSLAVRNARNYLMQFNGTERIYENMLAAAGKNIPALNFNRQFPGSAQVVVNSYEVRGAFTKDGFTAMQSALLSPQKFFGGEEWVVGDKNVLPTNSDSLQGGLRNRYYGDFVGQWRNFLRATRIVPYATLKDANGKLQVLSGNNSPLLELLHVAQKNTNVAIPNIGNSFQPLQLLAKDAGDQVVITSASQPYMEKLLALQSSVNTLTLSSAPQPDTSAVLAAAASAKNTVGGIAQSFRIDNDGHVDAMVKKLMEDPITYVESLAGKVGPEALNGAGKIFCGQYDALVNKYPFSAGANEATLQDVENVFKPGTGALWTFYDASLKTILLRQGSKFVLSPAPIKVSNQFISFMSHAAEISEALYPAGSQQPKFTYTLKQLPSKGVDQISLTIDGETLTGEGQFKTFTWTGSSGSMVKGTYTAGNVLFASEQGVWAPFHFMDNARWSPGYAPTLEWPLWTPGESHRQQMSADGMPMVIRYELSSGAQMFNKDSRGMRCPSVGAH